MLFLYIFIILYIVLYFILMILFYFNDSFSYKYAMLYEFVSLLTLIDPYFNLVFYKRDSVLNLLLPTHFFYAKILYVLKNNILSLHDAAIAQSVVHYIGSVEVIGSIPISSLDMSP